MLKRPNVDVHVQTDFIKAAVPTLITIDDYIKGCDIVIHLVGDLAGAFPKAQNLLELRERYPDLAERLPTLKEPIETGKPQFSYTQWEAYLAIYHRIHLLVATPASGVLTLGRAPADNIQKSVQKNHLQRLRALARYPVEFNGLDHLYTTILGSEFWDMARPDYRAAIDVAALYYEFTAFVDADFPTVRPEALERLHREVEKAVRKPAPTARGMGQGKRGGYVIELGGGEEPVEAKDKHRTIAGLATTAAEIVDDLQRMLVDTGVTPHEGVWDIRVVVTGGRVHKIHWGEHGQTVDSYVGLDLDIAMQRLSRISGGEASVIAREPRPLDSGKFYRVRSLPNFGREGYDRQIVWHYQRPWRPTPNTEIPIRSETISELGKPLLAGAKAEELEYHKVPSRYGDIRRTLLDHKLVVLVGAPGIGKSLCALRLVAELHQQDRCTPRLPRMAESAWGHIDPKQSKEVILLDDAFGKSFVRHRGYLRDAKRALCNFLGLPLDNEDASEAEDAKSPLDEDVGQLPFVIITVRPEIWDAVKREWRGHESGKAAKLEEVIEETHVFRLEEGGYGDLGALFERLLEKLGTDRSRSRGDGVLTAIAKRVGGELKHPMNVRDFFAELNQDDFDFEKAYERIRHYKDANPKARYLRELGRAIPVGTEPQEYSNLGFFFFMQVFSNAFLRKGQLEELFFHVTTAAPPLMRPWPRETPDQVWKRHQTRNERWGSWSEYGHFTVSHPLREEALREFFASRPAEESVERIFAAFSEVAGGVGSTDLVWRAAAFAAPQVGGRLGQARRHVMETALSFGGGSEEAHSPAVSLANAIGHALGAERDHPTVRLMEEDLQKQLIETLKALMERGGMVGAAAAAAVCDSYRGTNGGSDEDRAGSTQGLLELVHRTATAKNAGGDVKEQIAWAIVSNFAKLPDSLRNLLLDLTRDPEDWVRLRSLEAIADYYGDIKEMDRLAAFLGRFDTELYRGATDKAPIVARGVAGAFEANYKSVPQAVEWLLQMAGNRTSLGVLEWVVWSIGECLEDAVERMPKQTVDVFTRLALHEDARVRVWVARTLAEHPTALERKPDLSFLLARLADDPNEQVWNAASEVFFKHVGHD